MRSPLKPTLAYRLSTILVRLWAHVWLRFSVRGQEHVPHKGACLIAANHASFLDPPLLAVGCKHRVVRFMARRTLFKHPVANWYLRQVGVVPIDRDRGDVGAMRTVLRLLDDGAVVALFPEGTRTHDGELQESKRGIGFLIVKAGVPVVPVYIEGTYEAYPRHARGVRPHKVRLTFGEPITAAELAGPGAEKAAYDIAARLVMDRIGRLKAETAR